MVDSMRTEGYNFADVVSTTISRCEKRFSEGAKEAKLDDTDWVWEDELELLREEMRSVADQCRADETKKMLNNIEVSIQVYALKNMWLNSFNLSCSSAVWSSFSSLHSETAQF